MRRIARLPVLIVIASLVAGCATTATVDQAAISGAQRPAWSLDGADDEMVVAVSPARRTLQIMGSAGTLIGAGIAAVSNSRYRRAIESVLSDYDGGAVMEKILEERLRETFGPDLARVSAPRHVVGQKERQEAMKARFRALRGQGHDRVLDLNVTYGLFGYEGTLVAKIDGRMYAVDGRKVIWDNRLVVFSSPVLASDRLVDPTKRALPNLGSPRLSIEENAIEQWTGDGGALFRRRFEAAARGAVSAMLVDMGLADEPEGAYYLAKQLMNQKKFDRADAYYRKALAMRPDYADARNGLAVNTAHAGDLDGAIALAEALVKDKPDYAPAQYNLAWWYAEGRKDVEAARPYYERARELGLPGDKDLEKTLGIQ